MKHSDRGTARRSRPNDDESAPRRARKSRAKHTDKPRSKSKSKLTAKAKSKNASAPASAVSSKSTPTQMTTCHRTKGKSSERIARRHREDPSGRRPRHVSSLGMSGGRLRVSSSCSSLESTHCTSLSSFVSASESASASSCTPTSMSASSAQVRSSLSTISTVNTDTDVHCERCEHRVPPARHTIAPATQQEKNKSICVPVALPNPLSESERQVESQKAKQPSLLLLSVSGRAREGSRRVVLNVGGRRFETYVATLQRFPSSLLGTMFHDR
jgi:BTB/POZ domain